VTFSDSNIFNDAGHHEAISFLFISWMATCLRLVIRAR